MLQATGLTKRYNNSHTALDHLNLTIERGDVFCLLGANGAGKTTTINLADQDGKKLVAKLPAPLDKGAIVVVTGKDGGAWICRQCDLAACERATGRCPAANAAAAKYGRS